MKQIKSLIYFGSIAVSFNSPEEYSKHTEEVFGEPKKLLNEISSQIFINSQIALKKYQSVGFAMRFFIASMIVWTLFFIGLLV